ncbi:MAG: hypothetical protein IJZ19_00710 [Lentisphaeria bacterium]|nr:hypothetical protein [Lentisphaeria bacterium]
MDTDKNGELLLPSGGYRRLKSFQLAQLIYDITVHFVELYIPAESRINSKKEFREFIAWAENHFSVPIRTIPYKSVLVANAVLLLIDTASYFFKYAQYAYSKAQRWIMGNCSL